MPVLFKKLLHLHVHQTIVDGQSLNIEILILSNDDGGNFKSTHAIRETPGSNAYRQIRRLHSGRKAARNLLRRMIQ